MWAAAWSLFRDGKIKKKKKNVVNNHPKIIFSNTHCYVINRFSMELGFDVREF